MLITSRIFPFHSIRFILYFSIFGLYPLYLCYLIYNIINDKPNLKVDQIFLNEIDVPDIAICGTRELKILRCDFITNNDENSQLNGCNNYVLPDVVDYGIFRENCLTFKANKTIKFTKPDIGGLSKIGFYFYDNTTAAEANTIGIASITILVIPSDFNPVTNSNKAISQMDKATMSELKLQLNFIAGMSRYAAVVKFKTSTYRSILPGDVSAILGFRPNYHVTSKIENFYNYFPFNNNPYNIPEGTTGYFSVVAGSFIQEQTSEERSNTIYSAIAAAGGAFGTLGGVMAYCLYSLISTRYYPKSELNFSKKINDNDKKVLVDEFNNIRCTIYHYLLNQSNIDKTKKDKSDPISKFINKLINRPNDLLIKIYHWICNAKYFKKIYSTYKKDRRNLEFSSINDNDKKLLVDEFDKIRHIIDVYLLGKSEENPKQIATYKYKRELNFSENISKEDQRSLKIEFRKIRKLIDKHLLGKPDIEEIFDAYDFLKNNDFSEDMDGDKELLNNVFQQISYVIFHHLLDIPENENLFDKYKENVGISSFSKMDDHDKELLVNEFDKIKHVINCHLFNERKKLEVFEKYIKERELKFSSKNMSEKDKKLLTDKFRKIREVIDNFLLNEPIHIHVDFSDEMDGSDKELLISYINEIRKIRHDIDNYILNKV